MLMRAVVLLSLLCSAHVCAETIAERMKRVRAEHAAGAASGQPSGGGGSKGGRIFDAIMAADTEVSFNLASIYQCRSCSP